MIPSKNRILHKVPFISDDWKTEIHFQIKNTDTANQMEIFSFRSEENIEEAILRVAIQTQPTLNLVIELYGTTITLPQALVINNWYKLNIILHRLKNVVNYSGHQLLIAVNGQLEIDQRLAIQGVVEFTNVGVFSCHRLQPSCLRGHIKQFSLTQIAKRSK